MKNKNKLFADRYVMEKYPQLSSKFRVLDAVLNEKGVSSLDKLNDTIIALYENEVQFKCYDDFKKWADMKFTERSKR